MPRAIVGPLQKHIRITAAAAVVLGLVVIGSASLGVQAQAPPDPVQWSLSLKSSAVRPGGKVLATLTASIQPGWHLYSPTTPKGGPNPTKVKLADNSAVASVQLFEPAP